MKILKPMGILLIPVLLGIYPVLALFAYNIGSVNLPQISRVLNASLVVAVALTLFWFAALRNLQKAALVASGWLAMICSYGQIYDLLHEEFGAQIGRHLLLLPLALIVLTVWTVWVWRTRRRLDTLQTFFGVASGALVVMVSFFLAQHYLPILEAGAPPAPAAISSAEAGRQPDVYYIILDGHGRQDILQELYGYDDSSFVNSLKELGFYVAGSSHSNYIQTDLSLGSSLNLQYLDTIGVPTREAGPGRDWLEIKIRHSLVRQLLGRHGYRMVSFSNSLATIPADAEVYYDFGTTQRAAEIFQLQSLNEFERLFLASTIGRVALDQNWIPNRYIDKWDLNGIQQYLYHYEQIRFDLDKLAEVPDLPGDYFVFAHILAPHPPFVFDRQGGFTPGKFSYRIADGSGFHGTLDDYLTGYRNQAAYIDSRVLELVTEILKKSDPPPIIIIQGDHGPGAYLDWASVDNTNLDERTSILNAYYFPGDRTGRLYPSITPVNSFRVLFDEYFGGLYGTLPDKSYYSPWKHPFDFIDVTGRLKRP